MHNNVYTRARIYTSICVNVNEYVSISISMLCTCVCVCAYVYVLAAIWLCFKCTYMTYTIKRGKILYIYTY